MLTHFRYTIAQPHALVDDVKAIKNDVELEGMWRAYLRDGVSFVTWFAWLEGSCSRGMGLLSMRLQVVDGV
jgi:Xaa-Pro aminopeptidase